MAGLLLGTACSCAGVVWASRRGLAVAVANVAAMVVLVVTQRFSGLCILAVGAAALLGGVARPKVRPTWFLAGLALAAVIVFLTVPDTEGAVLLMGMAAVVVPVWTVGQWTSSPADVGVGLGATVGAVVVVAVVGAGGRWAITGWWIPKVVLVIGFGVALAITSGRARRSR